MFGTIIAAIVAIAGTAISAGVNSNQQEEARNEARGLAERNRMGYLKQQKIQNIKNRRASDLAEESFLQNKKMDEISMKNQQAETQKQIDTQNNQFIKQASQNVLGSKPQEESFLYKRSLLSRLQ